MIVAETLSGSEITIIYAISLQEGSIGKIVEWNGNNDYVGRVVIRYKKALIAIGEGEGKSWSSFFEPEIIGKNYGKPLKIQLLKPNETLLYIR